jgi:DNA (cytosine-5)-methyltransferase 1
MTSPPCQSFSLAGKRLGKDDKRGILFFNSHEFITKNEPRYFIFENVKGLLSDDGGKTFSEWLHLLGGKSVNGMPIVFPYDGAVPYHVYWKVLNAKDFGVPQNRERVFIIGIRDDVDNDFSFPKEVPLTKRLKDVLESEVDEKYYLSDRLISTLFENTSGKVGQFKKAECQNIEEQCCTLTARYYKMGRQDPYIQETPTLKQVGSLYENNSDAGRIYDEDGISCTIKSEGGGLGAKTGLYEVADVITHNMMPRSSTSGKGGTGHLQRNDGIAYCLDTGNTNAVEILVLNDTKHSQQRIYNTEGISPSILSGSNGCGQSPVKHLTTTKRIRKLTPRECFRLMDFPDTFDFSVVSNSQAYRQAGNSIVVAVLAAIINKLKL